MSGGTPAPAAVPFWTVARAAEALADVAARPLPRTDALLRAVATDTRTIAQDDLFVALAGERFDAHAFLAEAVAKAGEAV